MLPANAVIIGKCHIIVDHRNWIKQLADPCDILTVQPYPELSKTQSTNSRTEKQKIDSRNLTLFYGCFRASGEC
jgi:hypothetical protein